MDYDALTDESFTYDENGNRSNTGYATGANNRMTSDGTFNYTYDAEGNTLTRTRISNDPADDYLTEYTWDHRNRLTKVTFKDNSDDVTKVVEQGYDAFNRWVSRTVDPDGDLGSAAIEETYFVYDGTQIVLQFDGDAAGDLSHRYLWGPAVDQLFADEDATGDVLWALTDHQGTVRDVVEYNAGTNQTEVVNHNTYNAFGVKTSQTNAARDLLFGYTGRAFDQETGLQYNWHRWYNAETGRWMSEDPIKDGSNWAAYVSNDPANFIDFNGLEKVRAGGFRGLLDPETRKSTRKSVEEAGKAAETLGGALKEMSGIGMAERYVDLHKKQAEYLQNPSAAGRDAHESFNNAFDLAEDVSKCPTQAFTKRWQGMTPEQQGAAIVSTVTGVFAAIYSSNLRKNHTDGDTSAQTHRKPQLADGNPVLAELELGRTKVDDLIQAAKPSAKGKNVATHKYTNPGTHDPDCSPGTTQRYDHTKSVLPKNHIELFEKSVLGKRIGNRDTRWAIEDASNGPIYHRFQGSNGVLHWNGSTAGETASGKMRAIPMSQVPPEIRKQ